MHSIILGEVPNRLEALSRSRIRLVCNAAGALRPALAIQLRDTFKCTVLPSYGMTECMPITTPPLDYSLDRPGTSGVSAGPEIAILDGNDKRLPADSTGRICVRGSPVFAGYLVSNQLDKSIFLKDGWFDTGDMGYLDRDEYLYVTGRSKEVINRGGELISPFEVEAAIMAAAQNPSSVVYNRISETLAFSVPHDILQEVVAVVLVTPLHQPRADLRQLQEAVKDSLHQAKWPTAIVYMDDLPKGNNKVLRVQLGQRLSFDEITDEMKLAERHFEAICPPQEAKLCDKIVKHSCHIDCDAVADFIKKGPVISIDVQVSQSLHDGFPQVILARSGDDSASLNSKLLVDDLWKDFRAQLHGYLVPTTIDFSDEPIKANAQGCLDGDGVTEFAKSQKESISEKSSSSVEQRVCEIFSDILSCSASDISPESDFFKMGGDSLKAGRLLSTLRKELHVRLHIGMLFRNSQVRSLCLLIDQTMSTTKVEKSEDEVEIPVPQCTKTYSSTNPFLLCIQLLPLAVFYPLKRAFEFTVFLFVLSISLTFWHSTATIINRFLTLLFSMAVARLVSQTAFPLLGITMKWVLIGRYKEGMYPMWGPYHTQWWLVQKILSVAGKVSANFLGKIYDV